MKSKTSALAIAVLALGAALAGAYVSSRYGRTAEAAPASPDAVASFFQMNYLDAKGAPYDFKNYQGKIVVVNFWATWCVPCVEEIPALSRLSTEYAKHNVVFVGIGIDNANDIADFQKKVASSYPLLVGGAHGTELVRSFGDTQGSLPYTIVLGKKGDMRGTVLGKVKEAELRGMLDAAIKS